MTKPPAPLPGWYPDPAGGPGLRFWDGQEWTAVAPAPAPHPFPAAGRPTPPPPQPGKPGMSNGVKIGLGVGGVVIAAAALGSIGDSDTKKTSSSSSSRASASSTFKADAPPAPKTSSAPKTREIAAPGSAVRDGKFEFEVLGVGRSPSKKGIFEPELAKGEFFIVTLRVTNIGDKARSYSASAQHLIINGNKYDASSSISDETWREDINPGLSIDAQVMFDIPPGAVPEAIEVHDSTFSGGALLGLPPS